jgi:mRNA interferase RelE/StbE
MQQSCRRWWTCVAVAGDYRLVVARSAARAISEDLPEAVAAAAVEFISGPLLANPQRVGKRLRAPLDGKWSARRGQYRLIYSVDAERYVVTVLQIAHRRDSYK